MSHKDVGWCGWSPEALQTQGYRWFYGICALPQEFQRLQETLTEISTLVQTGGRR